MPVNQKLRERAVRITMLIVNDSMLSENEAKAVLVKNNYDIKKSVAQLRQEWFLCLAGCVCWRESNDTFIEDVTAYSGTTHRWRDAIVTTF